ncbi:hypothetical protein [Enterococcus phoeniculicola]|jgi:hypothetical protein|uniref:Uncharacterized protein n=1 Tax=Enterococcus phoeniculicola ATCC BAA-412 TaxID=1158610 RepID=R3TYQ8_9ENTE|nr:hypothetical protein [Enterococcus phoeniculicola]EOL46308.1 hypothetical protein UC3_01114 [Enterococcus phoeniculicola ATCC BAA-412]EOT76847.1 hypothetical protein I589_01808 [Enterococcus phoeniculicola ATCC BAA-412]
MSEDQTTEEFETKINEKKVITPDETETKEPIVEQSEEVSRTKELELTKSEIAYYEKKEKNRNNIIDMIQVAEEELADLKLRKSLMESEFPELLTYYQKLLLESSSLEISSIAQATLLEYMTYELLKPLTHIGLKYSLAEQDSWETVHFQIHYAITEQSQLKFAFKMKPINNKYQPTYMDIFKLDIGSMKVDVDDNQVLALIRYWSVDKLYSSVQLSVLNHELNQLLIHFKGLGFTVEESLLDNGKPLDLHLESAFELSTDILDNIFIIAMSNSEYDMEKTGEYSYEVLLDKEQSLSVEVNEYGNTNIDIQTGRINRSILDFFGSYPFLVPLMLR